MPGICGFINLDVKNFIKEPVVLSMLDSMRNLEEEKCRLAVERNVGLGIAACDIPARFISNSEILIVAVGEIYNMKAGCLTDTIADYYRKYNESCARYLEGQFNFCLWDKKQDKILLATDPFGTSTLNYYYDDKQFVFASQLQAILRSGVIKPSIDRTAIYNYLNFSYIPTPQTVYEGIKKLPAGCCVILSKGKIDIRRYWDIIYTNTENKDRDAEYYAKEIFSTVEKSVKKCIDVCPDADKIGAFLSGGLDSSTVCGMVAKFLGNNRVKAFSIGFKEEGYSEIEYVRIAAKHFKLKHFEYYITPKEAIEAFKILAKVHEEPFGNTSSIAAYYCMKLAKEKDVQFIFGGDGGDENFAGYTKYVRNKIFLIYQHLPHLLRRSAIEPLVFHLPFKNSSLVMKAANYIKHSYVPDPERLFLYNFYAMYNSAHVFSEDFLNQINQQSPVNILNDIFNSAKTQDLLNKLLYLDTKLGLIDNDLRGKIDKISKLLGIKALYPLLDKPLWELAARIPSYLKLKGFQRKYIFKKAFADFLPNKIIRKKKHGFGLPYAVWLRNNRDMRTFTENILLDGTAYKRGYFKKGFFEKIISQNDIEPSPYYGDILSVFLMLELWHRQWVDT